MTQKPIAKKSIADDPKVAQAIQNYEAGLRAMQEHKFDKARTHLQKAVRRPSKELADRACVHLNTCNQHLESTTTQFKSSEEHFDYAVSLMNVGDYVRLGSIWKSCSNSRPKPTTLSTGWRPLIASPVMSRILCAISTKPSA